jgi:hypothetical protein
MLLDKDADITARDEVSRVCVNVCVCIIKFTVRMHHLYGGLYVECCYFSYDESGLWVALNVIGSFFYLFNQTETKFLQISAGLDFTFLKLMFF